MSNFTLDDIRAAAEKKYAPTVIHLDEDTSVHLLNPLRLSKGKRSELETIQERLEAEDADQEEILRDAIKLIAETGSQAKALLAEVGDDLALLAEIFAAYTSNDEVGEA